MELQKNNKELKDVIDKMEKEEVDKRKSITDEFEAAVKKFKVKASEEMNEEELKKKNEELKAEMQQIMDDNKKNTEELEQKIKEKQKNSEAVQEKFKAMIQSKFEEALSESTKEKKEYIRLAQKEQELTAQISMYENNFDQLNDSIRKSGSVFSQFKRELKKKSEMLKTVEQQKADLTQMRERLDLDLATMQEEFKQLQEAKENLKVDCQNLQNLLKNT
eukprot:TRINITY_DN8554_c0_g7_i4.p2 TRINITY_DN8554_c0_g7~~TRINITY_DN8554_c0_g7_i4.p2  ORF type:complete len:219 (+),score=124.83 TRINITY_DN8554_c0_g7_i4:354-1010(+)